LCGYFLDGKKHLEKNDVIALKMGNGFGNGYSGKVRRKWVK